MENPNIPFFAPDLAFKNTSKTGRTERTKKGNTAR